MRLCSSPGEGEVPAPAGGGDRAGAEHGGQPGLGHAARPQGQVHPAQEPEHAVPGESGNVSAWLCTGLGCAINLSCKVA